MYHEPLGFLFDYWGRYCALDESHLNWLRRHAQVLANIKAGQTLFEPGQPHNYLYFVVSGLLAAVIWTEERHILRFAPSCHSILTTQTIYTDKQMDFQVLALRDSIVLRIPVAALNAYHRYCPEAGILINVLREKKLKQLATLGWLMAITHKEKRYVAFCALRKKNKLIHTLLEMTNQQEQAEYLNISESSITRARRGR